MQNIHLNIRNALLLSVLLLLCFIYDLYQVLTGTSKYSLDIDIAFLCFLSISILWLLYRSIFWKRNKSIRTYINSQSSRMATVEKLNYFLKTAPSIIGMQYDNNFISGRNFFGLELAEVKNIKGFRKSGRIARKYSIPVGKSNYLDLIMNDGTIVSLAFFHEYEVTHAIDILKKEYPSMTEYKTYVH